MALDPSVIGANGGHLRAFRNLVAVPLEIDDSTLLTSILTHQIEGDPDASIAAVCADLGIPNQPPVR